MFMSIFLVNLFTDLGPGSTVPNEVGTMKIWRDL